MAFCFDIHREVKLNEHHLPVVEMHRCSLDENHQGSHSDEQTGAAWVHADPREQMHAVALRARCVVRHPYVFTSSFVVTNSRIGRVVKEVRFQKTYRQVRNRVRRGQEV
jgi:hypothetical protein